MPPQLPWLQLLAARSGLARLSCKAAAVQAHGSLLQHSQFPGIAAPSCRVQRLDRHDAVSPDDLQGESSFSGFRAWDCGSERTSQKKAAWLRVLATPNAPPSKVKRPTLNRASLGSFAMTNARPYSSYTQRRTTMPMSALVLESTVVSSTRFMNWSKPRSTPTTARLPFRWTAEKHQKRAQ